MPETPGPSEDFERHPDIRGLQGIEGPHHPSLQAKLDLFKESPTLVKLADVPVDNTLRIRSLSAQGTEEEITFRRLPDQKIGDHTKEQWVLLRSDGDDVTEEPANLHGACASPTGTAVEREDRGVRQHAYFSYAVTRPVRFRHGSEVPNTPFADYKTPEEMMPPEILAQHLSEGWVFRGNDGLLYFNEVDQSWPGTGQKVTGQVTSAEIETPQTK